VVNPLIGQTRLGRLDHLLNLNKCERGKIVSVIRLNVLLQIKKVVLKAAYGGLLEKEVLDKEYWRAMSSEKETEMVHCLFPNESYRRDSYDKT